MAATNCSDGDKRHDRPRNGAIIPYPASQREKNACSRRHRGEMSLTDVPTYI